MLLVLREPVSACVGTGLTSRSEVVDQDGSGEEGAVLQVYEWPAMQGGGVRLKVAGW